MVDAHLGKHLQKHGRSAALNLLSYHYQLLCRFGDAALQLQGKGGVKPAIEKWLAMYNVDENEYSAETAYKLWQRYCWDLEKKNGHFFARSRGKAAAALRKNRVAKVLHKSEAPTVYIRPTRMEVEIAASKFVEEYKSYFRGACKKLHRHAFLYLYTHIAGISSRKAAAELNVPARTVMYVCKVMQTRAQKNPLMAQLLEQAKQYALPNVINQEANLPHATTAERNTAILRQKRSGNNPHRNHRADRSGYGTGYLFGAVA
jgi:hypothetical protein